MVQTVEKPVLRQLDVEGIRGQVTKLLKLSTFEPEHRYWLDTHSPLLNATLGSKKKGIPYGKLYEFAGPEHGGKTTLGLYIAGLAQKEGAAIGYIDLEDSRDVRWSRKLGLDLEHTYIIKPDLVKRKKKSLPRLQSVEELFDQAEKVIYFCRKQGFKKQLWLVDSIANAQTEMVILAGRTGQNMRTVNDRPLFLSQTLPQWVGLAANYNATIILINQLRDKPGVMFGDHEYTPGGRALRHNCSIRLRIRRKKGLRQLGKNVGLVGVIRNVKNKAGEGSVEGYEMGYRILWNRMPAKIEFGTVAEAKEWAG